MIMHSWILSMLYIEYALLVHCRRLWIVC
jgi:hypothetical protein